MSGSGVMIMKVHIWRDLCESYSKTQYGTIGNVDPFDIIMYNVINAVGSANSMGSGLHTFQYDS